MILNSKFDVLRGFPKEGAISETFPVYQPSGVPVSLPSGTIVYVRSDGTVDKATSPNRSTTEGISTWIVIEGNDDFSGTFLQKVVCLRSNAEIRTANFVAGSYAIGNKLTFTAGQVTVATTNNQIIGEVIAVDTTNGTIDFFYTGGDTAAK